MFSGPKFYYTLLLFWVFGCSMCFAQAPSLVNQINKLPEELRPDFITGQVKELYKKDSVKARKEMRDAILSFKSNKKILAALVSSEAAYHFKMKQFSTALNQEQQVLEINESLNDFEGTM